MTDNHEKINHESKRKAPKNAMITLIVLAVITIGGIIGIIHIKANAYNKYVTASNAHELSRQIAQYSNNKKLLVLMDFKTGCKDCEAVHDRIINAIKTASKNKQHYFVMVDSNNNSIREYLLNHGVTNTPTVVVLNNGNVVQQYSGDNISKLTRLLAAKDMNTGNPLGLTYSPNALLVNDEIKTNQTLSLNDHHNLNYNK